MNQKPTKKQHYVPQFYLRQWTVGGSFYPIKIEDKRPAKLTVFQNKSGTVNFCHENYFYAQYTGKHDAISQILEAQFAEIEGVFATKLPELEKKILNNEQITDDDKYHLCECMLFLHFRGKKYREWSQNASEQMIKQINKHLVHYMDRDPKMKAMMEETGITKEQMVEFAEKEEYTVEFGNMHHMQLMAEMYGFCNMLHAKYWKVYISKDGDFITTDAPYLDLPTSNHFYGNDFLSREQIFILSPRVMILAIYPHDTNGRNFTRKDITRDKARIRFLNVHNLMNSIRFGFHHDKSLLEGIKEAAENISKHKERERTSEIQKAIRMLA